MEARRAGGPREETIWAGAQMEARRAGMMWDETIGAGAGGLCDVRAQTEAMGDRSAAKRDRWNADSGRKG